MQENARKLKWAKKKEKEKKVARGEKKEGVSVRVRGVGVEKTKQKTKVFSMFLSLLRSASLFLAVSLFSRGACPLFGLSLSLSRFLFCVSRIPPHFLTSRCSWASHSELMPKHGLELKKERTNKQGRTEKRRGRGRAQIEGKTGEFPARCRCFPPFLLFFLLVSCCRVCCWCVLPFFSS